MVLTVLWEYHVNNCFKVFNFDFLKQHHLFLFFTENNNLSYVHEDDIVQYQQQQGNKRCR